MPLSFAAPLFLWALMALPVVVALHFVRSRRRRQDVSALFLWRRARTAAQRRRRFSPTWLLLAQLLFVTLAAVGLARPQLGGRSLPDRVLVIDASASMTARDTDGVRLEKARTLARSLLTGTGRVAVVRAGLDARVVAPLSSDRAAARSAIDALVAGDRRADLARAVGVAQAVDPGAEVHVLSDELGPGGSGVTSHDVAGDGLNVGISTFDVGLQQAYVGIVSNATRPVQVQLDLLRDGQAVAGSQVLVPAGGVGSATFPLEDAQGVLEARITPPAGDAMALDDVAYAGTRNLVAVVDVPSEPVVKALAAVPGVTVRSSPAAVSIPADLRVLTRASADGLDPGAYILFAPAADTPVFHTVREWDRAAPLLRFVDLRDVVIGLAQDRAVWPDDERGWDVLARTADLEPVLRVRTAGPVRVLQAAFHPSQTDLVLRPAFPALIANFVREVRGDATAELGDPLPAGTTSGGDPVAWALRPGVYRTGDGVLLASLTSEAESRLDGPATVAEDTTTGRPPATTEAPGGVRPLGLALLLVAFAALLAEWLLWAGVRLPRWPRRLRPRRG